MTSPLGRWPITGCTTSTMRGRSLEGAGSCALLGLRYVSADPVDARSNPVSLDWEGLQSGRRGGLVQDRERVAGGRPSPGSPSGEPRLKGLCGSAGSALRPLPWRGWASREPNFTSRLLLLEEDVLGRSACVLCVAPSGRGTHPTIVCSTSALGRGRERRCDRALVRWELVRTPARIFSNVSSSTLDSAIRGRATTQVTERTGLLIEARRPG